MLNDVVGGNTYKTTAIPASTATPDQVDQLQADVKNAVDNNRVVVANIAGTATDTDGDTHSYEGGHYLAVVGYRDGGKTVEISDPANPRQAVVLDEHRRHGQLDRYPRLLLVSYPG